MRLIDADALKAEWPEPIDWMDRDQVLCHITWFRAVIDNMPTIDPVKWIPVSERMPKPVAPSQRREWFITSNQYGGVTLTCYEFEESPFKEGWQTDMTILAWMPLPKPWRGEDGWKE